jgi:methionyl-tRNA synthetase
VALYPFLPFSSNQIHAFMGADGTLEASGWRAARPAPGTHLQPPDPLFKKIDVAEVDGEARLSA